MGSQAFIQRRPSSAAALLAVAVLLGAAGVSQAQLPIQSMVGSPPTADVWWNNWRYDQSPRAVVSPNMFGDVTFNRPAGFTTPTLATSTPGIPGGFISRQISGVLQQSIPPSAAPFAAIPTTRTLNQGSLDLLFLGRVAPNTDFTSQVVLNAPFPATVGIIENQAITQFIATEFAQPGERVVFNGASQATRLGPPNPAGANYNITLVYNLLTDVAGIPGVTTPALLLGMPNPVGGGLAGRMKVSTDNSPVPRDRLIYNFDHFNGAAVRPGGQSVNRQVVGFEKAFFDGRFSADLRLPFASTASQLSQDGVMYGGSTELGNLFLNLKMLLMSTSCFTVSGGLGFSFPTADDTRLTLAGEGEVLRIANTTTLLVPYVAVLWTPSDRMFGQLWVQGSFDPSGNPVRVNDGGARREIGKLYDAAQLGVDLQLGYWVLHPAACPKGWLRGLAPFAEVHWNSALDTADVVSSGNFGVFDTSGRYDDVSVSTGALVQFWDNVQLMSGLTLPLRGSGNRFSDYQLGVRMTWYFGGTAGAREVALPTF